MLKPLRNDTHRSLAFDAINAARATRASHPDVFTKLERDYGRVEFDGFDAHHLGLFEDETGAIQAIGAAYFKIGPKGRGASHETQARFAGRVVKGRFVLERADIDDSDD